MTAWGALTSHLGKDVETACPVHGQCTRELVRVRLRADGTFDLWFADGHHLHLREVPL